MFEDAKEVIRIRTDNAMANKTIHRKLKIERHELKTGD